MRAGRMNESLVVRHFEKIKRNYVPYVWYTVIPTTIARSEKTASEAAYVWEKMCDANWKSEESLSTRVGWF